MKLIVIGRDPKQADIVISNEYVSNYHAEIIQLDNGDMFIIDKSTNGTYLNGSRLVPGKETPLRREDSVTFTDLNIPLDWSMVSPVFIPEDVRQVKNIGSHYMNNIIVNGTGVSRFHATLREMDNGRWYICDHSKNGTAVNGRLLPKNRFVRIKYGDEISCAGIPVENPVKRKNNLWIYIAAGLAVCAAALIVFGLRTLKRPLSDEQLIALYDNSVVLMISEYHFEVNCGTLPIDGLPDPDSWNGSIFTAPLYDRFIVKDDMVIKYDGTNAIMATGTGFFVGDDGMLVTNRHVARPWEMDKVDYGSSVVTLEKAAEDYFRNKLTTLYEMGCTEALPYISQVKVYGVLDNMTVVPNGKYFNQHNVVNCTEVACSPESEDLALFKILSDQIPLNATPVPLDRIKPIDARKGAHILTIGFPMGLDLLDNLEKTEVQAHATSGSISRNDNRILFGFDAATRPGASGSPIFDEYGNLMGILNSGYMSTQGFNFGVRSAYLVSLLEKAGVTK